MDLEEFGTQVSDSKEPSTRRHNREDENPLESETEEERNKLQKTQWTAIAASKYVPCSKTYNLLLPGMYSIDWDNQFGTTYSRQTLNTDDLIDFPDSIFDKVEKEINYFWKLGSEFSSYGFLHKRGFLLYGPAGGGKSCLVSRICRNIIRDKGVVFIFERRPHEFLEGIALFRSVEPERQIVCVFEDIDTKIKEYGEASILSLLDGENQVNGVVNVATTNYPELLDRRIVSRPRRFDRIIKVDMPSADVRRIFFREKFKLDGEDIEKWVAASDEFSFAALSEMVIGVKCLKNDFNEVVERLKNMRSKKSPSSSDFEEEQVGFIPAGG